MNEEANAVPVMELILDRLNSRLSKSEELICNLRDLMDRLNENHPMPKVSVLQETKQPTASNNTVVNKLNDFIDSFERSNQRLETIYLRLREVV